MSDNPYTSDTQRLPRAEIGGCALVQDLIPLYLDGEVTAESRVLIADHLHRCERCSGYLAGARSQRQQILHEQRVLNAAMSDGPTVAQVQQPVALGLGVALWQTLMVLVYLGSLFIGLIVFVDHNLSAFLMASVSAVAALVGLLLVGSVRTQGWWALMMATGVGGLGLLSLSPLTSSINMISYVMYGTGMIGLAVWGISLHQVQHTLTVGGAQSASDAKGPAILGTLAALACAALIVFGLLIGMDAPSVEALAVGLIVAVTGAAGLLLINQRLQWLPQLALPATPARWFGYGCIVLGLALAVLALQLIFGLFVPLDLLLYPTDALRYVLGQRTVVVPLMVIVGVLVVAGLRAAKK